MKNQMDVTAVVTGGAQGIGRGIVLKLYEQGYRVAVCDIDPEAAAEIVGLTGDPDRVLCITMDVSDEQSVKEGIDRIVRSGNLIGALINNAGIADPFNTAVEHLDLRDWERIIRTNLTGMFLTSKYCLPYLKENHGSIINIASTRAIQSEPNTEAYASAKAGVVGLTHALAVSCGPEIRVNCISPGWIEVSRWQKQSRKREVSLSERDRLQHPAGRVGEPNDIAGLAAFLISTEAGFITGQNFIVDGGMTRKMIYEP
jgi:NAD(P)-dependent dehydrogenase (short-subunit alcohol dehydrogenase family)